MSVVNIEGLELIEEVVTEIKLIKDDTYDIEVEDAHHYILGNGIISHNTSIFAGIVSGGIEPVFMKEYTRWVIVTDEEKRALAESEFIIPDVMKSEWFETENLKFITIANEQILEGEFNGESYRVDKSRGLVKANLVEDYGWSWVKANIFSDEDITWTLLNKDEDVFSTTVDLSVENHLSVLKIIAHYTNMNSSKCVEKSSSMIIINDEVVYLSELEFNNSGEFKSIESDKLYTKNHINNKVEIKSTYNNKIDSKCIKISFSDNSTIIGTLNHKIFVENSHWVKLIDTKIDQNIVIRK